MMAWFESLEPRERAFVAGGALVVAVAIFWVGVWVPLDSGQKGAAERVAAWQQGLADLAPLKGQVRSSGTSRPSMAGQNQSLVVIVDQSLRQRGLDSALQRSQPTPGGNGIRVEFEGAAFDDLMLWIGDLNRQYGLQVESGSFSVTSSSSPGRVNSSVTLQR